MRTAPDLSLRLKRLLLRSWRRGTKEMDLILGPYADALLADMSEAELANYETMLSENDQDLYAWITGQQPSPPTLVQALDPVRRFHGIG